MTKQKLTLSVEHRLVEAALHDNLNISAFLEDALGKKYGFERHETWERSDSE